MNFKDSENRTVGIVETQQLRLELPAGGLCLEKGGCLQEVEVAYERCGYLASDCSNVIFVCHALTGDAHVAGMRPGETSPSGWWEGMIGSGRGIDTRYYHVICANILGGCKGTTGPSSINPATGRPYGAAFPEITVRDMVTVQYLLLQQLGIKRLAAVIGGSFGGMQVLEWMVRFPDNVAHALVIASAASLTTQALAFDIIGRQAIVNDPAWQQGDYYYSGQVPVQGLANARKLGHVTYLSQQLMNDKFGREERKEWLEAGDDFHEESRRLFRTYFEIESYLNYQGLKFVQRFDANSYLHITRAMDEYDLEKQFGSLEKAFADVKARVLVVALSGDWLFMPEQAEELASALIAQRKHVSYCCLEAPAGHDAFLTHITDLSLLIRAFLPWVSVTENIPRSVSAPDNRVNEYNAILEEVPEGCRVLDLGCGNGVLLDVMKEQRNVQGMGVDISVHAVAQTLDHGHDVLLEDINDGLAIVPDDTFDVAILSETLQVMQQPRETIKDILRVAREATVVFPNFGSMNVRLKLLLRGRMPKNRQLPYEWYDTPNIHLFTLRDFLDLCKQDKIRVKKVRCFCDSIWSRLLVAIGLRNLGADRVLVHVERA